MTCRCKVIKGQEFLLSNDDIDKDSEYAYIRRQERIRAAIRYSCTRSSHIFPLPAPTGSGKNRCSAEVVAQIYSEWKFAKKGKLCPDSCSLCANHEWSEIAPMCTRRNRIVVVIPQTENRTAFAKDVSKMLRKNYGYSTEEISSAVIDLTSNSDSVLNYFYTPKGHPPVATLNTDRSRNCPFVFTGDEAENLNTGTRKTYAQLVDAAQAYFKGKKNNSLDKRYLDELRDDVNRASNALARQIGLNQDLLTMESRKEIPLLWPAAKLNCDELRIVVTTPQKYLMPINTVIDGTLDLLGPVFARRAIYILDEFDKQKADWMECLAGGAKEYSPAGVVRSLYLRCCTLEGPTPSPLIRGELATWKRYWAQCKELINDSPVAQDISSPGIPYDKIPDIAENTARMYNELVSLLDEAYSAHTLKFGYRCERGKNNDEKPERLFDYDDMKVKQINEQKYRSLVVSPDNERELNTLRPQTDYDDDPIWLKNELHDLRRIIRQAVALLDYVFERLYGLDWPREHPLGQRAMIEALGFDTSKAEADELLSIWQNRRRANMIFRKYKGRLADSSLYTRGAGIVKINSNNDPDGRVTLNVLSLELFPEALLAGVAREAPVIAMSATWNAPTVTNWNILHLRDIEQVLTLEEDYYAIIDEIRVLTDEQNAADCKKYSPRAELLWADEKLVSLLLDQGEATLSIGDENLIKAVNLIKKMGVGDDAAKNVVELLYRMTADLKQEEDLKNGAAFHLRRIIKYLSSACRFRRRVESGDSFAGILLTQIDLSKEMPTDIKKKYALPCIREVIQDAVESGKGFFAVEDEGVPGAPVMSFNASSWDDPEKGFRAAKARLEAGCPALLVVNTAAGGFSKNLQYKAPDVLKGHLVRLEHGLLADINDVDFDFEYIESPTNRLHATLSKDSERDKSAILCIGEQAELERRFETTKDERAQKTRAILRGEPAYRLGLKQLPSSRVEGARCVAQASGRLSRTCLKMPNPLILVDEEINDSCDFSFLRELPRTAELDAVMAVCTAAPPSPVWANVLCHREQNEAQRANRQSRHHHERLLAKLFRDNAGGRDLYNFDDERGRTVSLPVFDWFNSPQLSPGERNHRIHAPHSCRGYVYVDDGSLGKIKVEFPLEGEVGLDGARARLSRRIEPREDGRRPHICEVSMAAARVDELARVDVVRLQFEKKGIPYDADMRGDGFITPYMFQTVYKGALGEEALYAILSSELDERSGGRLALGRGDAKEAERTGDFQVFVADGRPTGVWIDAKHYQMTSFMSREPVDDAAQYEYKAELNDARRLIVVNVLADDDALQMRTRAVGSSGKVYSVPYLIENGEVNIDKLRDVISLIEGALPDDLLQD